MTDTEKLTKVIEKAVKGGWLGFIPKKTKRLTLTDMDIKAKLLITYNMPGNSRVESYERYLANGFIFSHDFAKAYYGDERHHGPFDPITANCVDCGAVRMSYYDKYGDRKFRTEYCWEHNLQQQVISEDPIGYLYSHL